MPSKRNEIPREDLVAMLEPKVTVDLGLLIDSLMEDDTAEWYLSAFINAGLMYLILLRELAINDPDVEDPMDSDYACPVELEAARFMGYVEDTFANIWKIRRSFISSVLKETINDSTNGPPASFIFSWTDYYTSYKYQEVTSCVNGHWTNRVPRILRKNVEHCREKYMKELWKSVSVKLSYPQLAAGAFNKCSE